MQDSKSKALFKKEDVLDSCGFGLIVDRNAHPSRKLVTASLAALHSMEHRGGLLADGRSGDGCGLLVGIPHGFFTQIASYLGISLPQEWGIAVAFLPHDAEEQHAAKSRFESLISDEGLKVFGWREAPVDSSQQGEISRSVQPHIAHAFVGMAERHLNAQLRSAMIRSLVRINSEQQFGGDLYIASLSADTMVYKGMLNTQDISKFYLDLQDERFQSHVCVFHQRFATNTNPDWRLAQPFHNLAHNGEINTVGGNLSWSRARARGILERINLSVSSEATDDLRLVHETGSDSCALDSMLTVARALNIDIPHAARVLIQPSMADLVTGDRQVLAFHEYNRLMTEAWDGPAGVVATDGRYALCFLDRNGLRPARYQIEKDGWITIATEAGVHPVAPNQLVERGRLGPGDIVAVDTWTGKVHHTADVDANYANEQDYETLVETGRVTLDGMLDDYEDPALAGASQREVDALRSQFGIADEEIKYVLTPLAETALEPTGSMGDDIPIAALSHRDRSLFDYFRQSFAQVTNPAIDSLRESQVMTLETHLGAKRGLGDFTTQGCPRLELSMPILSRRKYLALRSLEEFVVKEEKLSFIPEKEQLQDAVERLVASAQQAIDDGATIFVLTDEGIDEAHACIPALLAVGAVHTALVRDGTRMQISLVVGTGSAWDTHQLAVLLGCGATAVEPWLAQELIVRGCEQGFISSLPQEATRSYRRGISKGLYKILAKMGICSIASYRGAGLFEVIGLSREVTDMCFASCSARFGGVTWEQLHQRAVRDHKRRRQPPEIGGLMRYNVFGERHAYEPDIVLGLQEAVRSQDASAYKKVSGAINSRVPLAVRDHFSPQALGEPVALEEVEDAKSILPRFDSAGMSLGALSPEAHEVLAAAMNGLGARSNSGEGGEDPARFGTEKVSRIKQVASGRFGVTPHYLVNADVIQIKVAQGAKPGEGGQLPGHKVNSLIARLRHSVPGVTLISPPPHHDIYSIEDLAQLIYDLKSVNPSALVSVKLVAQKGVGTIACGVVKTGADLITISGHDGGTGASPLSSIRYAGIPWEMGIAETQQALSAEGFRDQVIVQADGGLKTGLDVVKAALLGADSFGFGTAPMVAAGCKMLRICHLNNCATGVATQNEELRRDHFRGEVKRVQQYFLHLVEEVRGIMASLGVTKFEDLIGRTDLIKHSPDATSLELGSLLLPAAGDKHHTHTDKFTNEGTLNAKLGAIADRALTEGTSVVANFDISNSDRSVGAAIAGVIAKKAGKNSLPAGLEFTLNFNGSAGQSFGVWNAGGTNLVLRGEANDGVGKGMAGGVISVAPPDTGNSSAQTWTLAGNSCLYGATGGSLYVAGRAGERFAVRNSGANAVVEGIGHHGCEYMTGGAVAVLGPVGANFGAGMTGGFAYLLDEDRTTFEKVNIASVKLHRLTNEDAGAYRTFLRSLLNTHIQQTGSLRAQEIMANSNKWFPFIWLAIPDALSMGQAIELSRQAA